jgi:4-hydroxybenzoate polyprenyltransferase
MAFPLAASTRHRVIALLLACHPGPTLAVTLLAGLLAVAAGAQATTTGLVVAAFLAGQLSVGWSNDWLDAARDASVGRRDKPVATGAVRRSAVGRAAAVAAVAAVPLSLALGWAAGAAHLVAVGSAWSYNLRLKRTAWSWLPFALSFGLLPAVVTLALPGTPAPPWWTVGAGALLGVGAHLVNVLPDLDDDLATGVNGLVQRLGRTAAAVLAPVVLVAATVLVAVGPPGPVSRTSEAGLAVAALSATVAAAVAAHGKGASPQARWVPLLATAVVALVDVGLLLGTGLTG